MKTRAITQEVADLHHKMTLFNLQKMPDFADHVRKQIVAIAVKQGRCSSCLQITSMAEVCCSGARVEGVEINNG
jgi:hypothetical protein